ncbi:rCG43224 [Rattus norvegicus]|uniref:RCG43224 n=1 Tax=Rattus norvegicus TaxID=10116 RepID=A6IWB2_RAT|nr:rCG43224 [Rattus norvegicus]
MHCGYQSECSQLDYSRKGKEKGRKEGRKKLFKLSNTEIPL